MAWADDKVREWYIYPNDLSDVEKIAQGYIECLYDYGIWKDGVCTIGCACAPVNTIREEILTAIEQLKQSIEKKTAEGK